MKIWEAAVEVLSETNNDAVMWGDSFLLHMISKRAGKKPKGWRTETLVLQALSRCPGPFIKRYTRAANGRLVLVFRLESKP